MDSDSDDDMPVLSSVTGEATAAAGTPAIPAPQPAAALEGGGSENGGGGGAPAAVGNETAAAEVAAETQFIHPASKGVLVPHKLFGQAKVHPGAVEPVVRDAKQASALKEQGNAFFKKGQFRFAEECYTEALRTAPLTEDFDYSRAVYFGNRAAVYQKMTLYDKCIADCSEAIALQPKYVKVIMRRAKVHELKEDLEAALADVKMVLDIDPSYLPARQDAVRLEKAVTEKQEKMKEEVLGKLKSLGNTILGKFGLSLDNFKMTKGEDGGYSMNFQQ